MRTDEEGDSGKRSKTLSEVKPVKREVRIRRVFRGYVPRKRKSFFHINYETMHMSNRILSD